jgi:hypothetical protein
LLLRPCALLSEQGSYVLGLLLCTVGLFSGECGYVSILFLWTGGLIRGQGSMCIFVTVYRWVVYWTEQLCCGFLMYNFELFSGKSTIIWVCYCVPRVCLEERAAMFFVWYCVTEGRKFDEAAMLWVYFCVTVGCLVDRTAMF